MSDATVEINTFVKDAGIDGVITDFPKTANRYRSKCVEYLYFLFLELKVQFWHYFVLIYSV